MMYFVIGLLWVITIGFILWSAYESGKDNSSW